jgi:RNA ligase (TIGR02306 family)
MQSELANEIDNEFVATEKLDGLSEAIYKYNDAFGVCSKHVELFDTEGSLYWKIVKQYDLETKLRKLNRNISLQGELIGWGIRANKYKFAEGQHDFYLFKVFDIDNHCYLNFDEMLSVAKELGLKVVPIVSDSLYVTNDIEELVDYSGGRSMLNPQIHREGVVISRKQADQNGVTFSFKVINPVFLLKYQDD